MNRFYRNVFEKIFEGLLTFSGTVTSLIVILIIVFLFREGITLFSQPAFEEGYITVLHESNPTEALTAEEFMAIFEKDITSWKELGWKDQKMTVFTLDEAGEMFSEDELGPSFENLPTLVSQYIQTHPGVLAVFPEKFIAPDIRDQELVVAPLSVWDFLFGKYWYPTATPAPQFGALPLLLGSLWVTFGAICFALPLGLATAIYLSEIAGKKTRKTVKPMIELLAGIPSVVYGFFGLVVVVPLVQDMFGLIVGETLLVGSMILGLMALPTIITISEDALQSVPRKAKEASLALGATHWQTIVRVMIPYARSGITAAAILGIARAIGETMAVLMVTGNAAVIPDSFLEPGRTMTATIAAELGEAPYGGLHFKALFAIGCLLFIITFFINLGVEFIAIKKRK